MHSESGSAASLSRATLARRGPHRAHSSVCSVARYAFSAALEAEYSAWPGAGTTAAMDDTATMRPRPREICRPRRLNTPEQGFRSPRALQDCLHAT